VIVHVSLAPVLLLGIPMRHVHVLERWMVVLVGVGGQEVPPVLPAMQVMRHVEVLVAVLQRAVLVTGPRLGVHHTEPPDRSSTVRPSAKLTQPDRLP
jgi:hypothetical protein